MKYTTITYFIDESGEEYRVGDIVTINYPNGGGLGSCEITKITNTGFHFTQGKSKTKSIQFKDIANISKNRKVG